MGRDFSQPFIGAERELAWTGLAEPGDRGQHVRRVQEWLSLHGHPARVDGDFGEGTSNALRAFLGALGLPPSPCVDADVFAHLSAPLARVCTPMTPPEGARLGDVIVAVARQHLTEHPREVGPGPNAGPWVRAYMHGLSGAIWPWCAGFVSFILAQACGALQVPLPIRLSFGVPDLVAGARARRRFVPGAAEPHVLPGDLFAVRNGSSWSHTGIVTQVMRGGVATIEANTNAEGAREGTEARARMRPFDRLDFIRLGDVQRVA